MDPVRLAGAGLAVTDVENALANANAGNAGGGFYSQGGQFYYVRGLGRLETLDDIGNVVLATRNGVPILVKDVGQVVVGHALGSASSASTTRTTPWKADPDAEGRSSSDGPQTSGGEDP